MTLRGPLQPGPRQCSGENCCHGDPRRGRLRQLLGLHPGATPAARLCKKDLFYGAFSKPFYYGGEGGIPHPFWKIVKNAAKIRPFGRPASCACTIHVYHLSDSTDTANTLSSCA